MQVRCNHHGTNVRWALISCRSHAGLCVTSCHVSMLQGRAVTAEAIRPSKEQVKANRRSRSAFLRVFERLCSYDPVHTRSDRTGATAPAAGGVDGQLTDSTIHHADAPGAGGGVGSGGSGGAGVRFSTPVQAGGGGPGFGDPFRSSVLDAVREQELEDELRERERQRRRAARQAKGAGGLRGDGDGLPGMDTHEFERRLAEQARRQARAQAKGRESKTPQRSSGGRGRRGGRGGEVKKEKVVASAAAEMASVMEMLDELDDAKLGDLASEFEQFSKTLDAKLCVVRRGCSHVVCVCVCVCVCGGCVCVCVSASVIACWLLSAYSRSSVVAVVMTRLHWTRCWAK